MEGREKLALIHSRLVIYGGQHQLAFNSGPSERGVLWHQPNLYLLHFREDDQPFEGTFSGSWGAQCEVPPWSNLIRAQAEPLLAPLPAPASVISNLHFLTCKIEIIEVPTSGVIVGMRVRSVQGNCSRVNARISSRHFTSLGSRCVLWRTVCSP